MEQQYLTVKQFAERAGVSTQRIYQLLTKSLQEFTKTEHGKKYIAIEGLRLFEKEPLQNVAKGLQSNLQHFARAETEILMETVEVLRRQLAIKDEQLAAKDKQIGNLTAALLSSQEQHKALTDAMTTAQALHAGTIQRQLVEQSSKEDVLPEEQTQPKPKQGFLSRIFEKRSK